MRKPKAQESGIPSNCGSGECAGRNSCKHYWKEFNSLRSGHSTSSMHKKRFGGLREKVITRDKGRCRGCGMSREEHRERWGRDITVDHIDGRGRNKSIMNNTIDNLQVLCLKCHSRKDSTKYWASKGA